MSRNVIGYICGSKNWGESENNQFKNAKWMTERGHKVCVFGITNSKLHQACDAAKIPFEPIKAQKKSYQLLRAIVLRKKIKIKKITHLFVRDSKDMKTSALAKILLSRKLVLVYFMEEQLELDKTDWVHTFHFKQFDFWSCPLPYLKEQVIQFTNFPEEKIVVIPSALKVASYHHLPSQNESRDVLGLPENKKILGLVGTFEPQKGQFLLLQALKMLKPKYPDLGIIFIGEKSTDKYDEYYEEVNDYIKNNDLKAAVFIQSSCENERVFYAAIDAFVIASKAETFGVSTLKAMACGIPIIGSRAGGTTELLKYGEFGRLFDTMNLKSLQDALEDLIENPTAKPNKLLAEAQQYDCSIISQKIEELLDL